MLTKKTLTLPSADGLNDPHGLLKAERDTLPFSPQHAETPSLDAELLADFFYLTRRRPEVPGNVCGVDPDRLRAPVIHNAFFVPGKVPSLNELLDARGRSAPRVASIIMRRLPKKGKAPGIRHDAYNDIKQDWKQRTIDAIGVPFVRVQQCFFAYLVVEDSRKRDPSNVCSSAIKFIEDGIVEAGVMSNDGWDNILGIRVHWVHRKGRRPGIYVVMSDVKLSEEQLEAEYEDSYLQGVF